MPCSHYNWGWEKDAAVSSTPGWPITASMSPLGNSVECQCHVGYANFYSSSYLCTSSSRSMHIWGSSGKTSGESSIVWISFFFSLLLEVLQLVGWLVGFFPLTLSTCTCPSQAFTLYCLFPCEHLSSLVNYSLSPSISIDIPSTALLLECNKEIILSHIFLSVIGAKLSHRATCNILRSSFYFGHLYFGASILWTYSV